MSLDSMTIDSPSTKSELEESLNKLVQRAHLNGVTVTGGYELLHATESTPDWDLTIIRLK
jgi:hypothetical protein